MFRQIAKMLTDSHQGPSLDAMLEPMDAHLKNFDHLVEPAPDSKPRTPLRQRLAEK